MGDLFWCFGVGGRPVISLSERRRCRPAPGMGFRCTSNSSCLCVLCSSDAAVHAGLGGGGRCASSAAEAAAVAAAAAADTGASTFFLSLLLLLVGAAEPAKFDLEKNIGPYLLMAKNLHGAPRPHSGHMRDTTVGGSIACFVAPSCSDRNPTNL